MQRTLQRRVELLLCPERGLPPSLNALGMLTPLWDNAVLMARRILPEFGEPEVMRLHVDEESVLRLLAPRHPRFNVLIDIVKGTPDAPETTLRSLRRDGGAAGSAAPPCRGLLRPTWYTTTERPHAELCARLRDVTSFAVAVVPSRSLHAGTVHPGRAPGGAGCIGGAGADAVLSARG